MEKFIETGTIEGLFSIAVAAYLLVRMESKLDALDRTLAELTHVVRSVIEGKYHGDNNA